ncbi:MAG: hypothetical protein SGBAC_009726, partial [Bacillariaceae sp.]
KRKVDYAKECVAETGAYVQGFGHETHRNQKTRTVDGIYLCPADNYQKGHILMDLNTRRRVTQAQVKVLPIRSQVIKVVEDMASRKGLCALHTYSHKNSEVILDGDLLAGVDPDELWDEEYTPEEGEPAQSDHNLRSERIDQNELDDLIEDARDMLAEEDTDIMHPLFHTVVRSHKTNSNKEDCAMCF